MVNKSRPSALDEQVATRIAEEHGVPMERARRMVQLINEFHSIVGEIRNSETSEAWDSAMSRLKESVESMKAEEPELHSRMKREISETIAELPVPPVPSELLGGLNPPQKAKKKDM